LISTGHLFVIGDEFRGFTFASEISHAVIHWYLQCQMYEQSVSFFQNVLCDFLLYVERI